MIEMANDQVLVTKIDKLMEETDRITAAGNTDEIAMRLWKLAEKSSGLQQARRLMRLHQANVQRSTLNVQRSIKPVGRRSGEPSNRGGLSARQSLALPI